MSRPTEDAEAKFQQARVVLGHSILKIPADSENVAQNGALINIAEGLIHLSVGLRATYILLEDVKRLLQQKGR